MSIVACDDEDQKNETSTLSVLTSATAQTVTSTPTSKPSPPTIPKTPAPSASHIPLPGLTVHFIDVGQGDAILIDLKETEVLIDGGDRSPDCVDYLEDFVDGDLEVMVATHPHADHIGGLIDVLKEFTVQQVWHNGDTSTSKTYAFFMAAVESERAEVHIARLHDTIKAGDLSLFVHHPANLEGTTNNNSIVLSLKYGDIDFMFMGDAEQEAESEMTMLSSVQLPQVEVLKVGHHGSRTASSQAFIDIIQPETAIIMCGDGNTYGHPHEEALSTLVAAGATIYRADQLGTIMVTTRGVDYRVTGYAGDFPPPAIATPADTSSGDYNDGSPVIVTVDTQGKYISFPAAGVKLIQPKSFEIASDYYGFQYIDAGASVMVSMIPGPYTESTSGFTADQAGARGMELISKETLEIEGMSGMLISVAQNAHDIDFEKWILVFGDENTTRMVVAAYPLMFKEDFSDLLKATVLSAKLVDISPPTVGADVGFTIVASDKLTLVESIGMKLLAYTKDGVIPAPSPEDPLFIAGPSIAEVPIDNEKEYAIARLYGTANTNVISVVSTEAVTIGGLKGYEIIANAEHSESGIPLLLYQVMLFDEGFYILMQGLVGFTLVDNYLPEFKSMAHSFEQSQY